MITTVTLNASIDKAYYLESNLTVGSVMRVKNVINSAGGKGLNVARIVKLLGEEVLATGFVGGHNGDYLLELLNHDGIESAFTTVKCETRSCINVIEDNFRSTEFLEGGEELTEEEIVMFENNFSKLIEKTDVVTISGSMPKGLTSDFYRKLIKIARAKDKKVILDSSGSSFEKGLNGIPTLVKPNKYELEALFHRKIESISDVIELGKRISEKGIEYVVISLGKDGAIMIHKNTILHAQPPKIKAINTVGCGDSMVAALAFGLKNNFKPADCLKYAAAVGTANAMTMNTGSFNKTDFDNILTQVKVDEVY